jgi:uncharacterized protein (TIGR03067 family)
MNLCLLTVLASGLFVGQVKPAEARPAEKSALEGEWAVVVWDFDGFWFTAVDGLIGDHYRDLRFTFTADRMKIKLRENGQSLGWWGWDWVDSPYKIDPTKERKEIDIDQLGSGIYSIRGDRLVICLVRQECAKRPTEFQLKPNGADTLIQLERVKKQRE